MTDRWGPEPSGEQRDSLERMLHGPLGWLSAGRSRGLCGPRTWGLSSTPGTASRDTQHPPPNLLPCRRLLSIRGVNDVLLSKGFLNPVYLPPTHDVHKGGGRREKRGSGRSGIFPHKGDARRFLLNFTFTDLHALLSITGRRKCLSNLEPIFSNFLFQSKGTRERASWKKRGKGVGRGRGAC